MKSYKIIFRILCGVCLASLWFFASAQSVTSKAGEIQIHIHLGTKSTGKNWYQMALWIEDDDGNYVETLYVTSSVGREGLGNGYMKIFGITFQESPGSLPVWAHRRNVIYGDSYYPPKKKPLPDAMTGATIKASEFMKSFTLSNDVVQMLGDQAWHCLLEINVSRDGVPSMVYRATVDPEESGKMSFQFVGYGEKKGRDGGFHDPVDLDLSRLDILQFATLEH